MKQQPHDTAAELRQVIQEAHGLLKDLRAEIREATALRNSLKGELNAQFTLALKGVLDDIGPHIEAVIRRAEDMIAARFVAAFRNVMASAKKKSRNGRTAIQGLERAALLGVDLVSPDVVAVLEGKCDDREVAKVYAELQAVLATRNGGK